MYNKSNLIVQQMLEKDRHQSMKQANNSFRRELGNDGFEENVSDEMIAQRNAQYPPLDSKEAAIILNRNPATDEVNEDLEREVDKYFDHPIMIVEESKDVAEQIQGTLTKKKKKKKKRKTNNYNNESEDRDGIIFQDIPQPAVNNFQLPRSNGSKQNRSNFIIPEIHQIQQEDED